MNLGQYLEGGAAIVPLQAMDPVYVDFALPQEEVRRLRVGVPVDVSADSASNLPVEAGSLAGGRGDERPGPGDVPNPDGKLRPGMFVEVHLHVGSSGPVVASPRPRSRTRRTATRSSSSARRRGRTGRATPSAAALREARHGARDLASVVSGLKPGETVVTSGVFKLGSAP